MESLKQQKILFLSLYTFGLTGGIEKVCRAISKALSDFKSNNLIGNYQCMSMYDGPADSRYLTAKHFKGFHGNRLNFGFSAVNNGRTSDIIILSHLNLLLFGLLIKKLKPKARIILFAHGIEIWKPLNNWKRKFLQQNVEIWAVSRYTADRIKQQHDISASNINVLNNCIDPFFKIPSDFGKPIELMKRYGLSEDKKILFTLTRLSSEEKYKGYDQVLAAMKHLPKNIHYILGGKADENEQQHINTLIAEYKLQHRVTLTGYIADEEVTDHYLLADIFVMPSSAEGFGISFIEASACGCQVIAGNQDGSKDALLNGGLGILIDPLSVSELEVAITKSLEMPVTPLQQQQKTLSNFGFSSYKHKLQQSLVN